MTTNLVTAAAHTQLSSVPGRAIASARGHHIIVDSPPTLNGPNEELNPVDILLIALSTCATFLCESAALEAGIPLHSVNVEVAGDFDPRGICGEPVESGLQTVRVRINFSGPTQEQAQFLVKSFRQRCPVYGSLSKAVPINIETF